MDRKSFAFELAREATKIGLEFGLQIGDNQPGATLGAEDDVRKNMTEGPTHGLLMSPHWGLGCFADIYPQLCAVGYRYIASFAGSAVCKNCTNSRPFRAVFRDA